VTAGAGRRRRQQSAPDAPAMSATSPHTLPFWLHSRYVLAATVLLGLLAVATALGFIAYERGEMAQATQKKTGEIK